MRVAHQPGDRLRTAHVVDNISSSLFNQSQRFEIEVKRWLQKCQNSIPKVYAGTTSVRYNTETRGSSAVSTSADSRDGNSRFE